MQKIRINLVSCHRKPERSFFWRGKQFPFCSRCTGIYIGYLTFPFFVFGLFDLSLIFSFILIIPTVIDGLTQAYFNRESTNLIRVCSGVIAGLGIVSIIHLIGERIGLLILNIL
ncbi:MAG: hypothetical protein CMP66_06365 [Flavobacteriales bacterium]|nr:hypothetical protein [Flavobacteriales bacterium]MBJ11061.1 hypothetical protein [Flavobacteriales bacterium]|tara:strand:- start:13219 stop:13560 length:342 start_codon:yes stop_codon:yes gene_type:complete